MADPLSPHPLWLHTQYIARQIEDIYEQELNHFNLSAVEWHVMQSLYEQNEQTANALARASGRAATSFTPILDKLVQKGWIMRRTDAKDRRSVRIHLTEEAESRRKEVQRSAARIESVLQGKLDADDMAALQRIKGKLSG